MAIGALTPRSPLPPPGVGAKVGATVTGGGVLTTVWATVEVTTTVCTGAATVSLGCVGAGVETLVGWELGCDVAAAVATPVSMDGAAVLEPKAIRPTSTPPIKAVTTSAAAPISQPARRFRAAGTSTAVAGPAVGNADGAEAVPGFPDADGGGTSENAAGMAFDGT